MTAVEVRGQYQLRALSARLREAGTEGQGLRRALYRKNREAVKPLAQKIASFDHLQPYMPDRYAAILAEDLGVRVSNHFSKNPSIEIRAKARQHKRKVVLLDNGVINHPVFAQGARKTWSWSNAQTGGMKPGFFTDAVTEARPEIRDKVMEALTETARYLAGK